MGKSPFQRREKSNNYIKSKGIACFEGLPLIEESKDVKLKSLDTIVFIRFYSFLFILNHF